MDPQDFRNTPLVSSPALLDPIRSPFGHFDFNTFAPLAFSTGALVGGEVLNHFSLQGTIINSPLFPTLSINNGCLCPKRFCPVHKELQPIDLNQRPGPALTTSIAVQETPRSARKRAKQSEGESKLTTDASSADSKKSVEEWKRLRLRLMSRVRKQRWRAKKKAELESGSATDE